MITSLQNPLVKEILLLQEKSRYRKKTLRFVVEGRREISLAIKSHYEIEMVVYQQDTISEDFFKTISFEVKPLMQEVSREVFKKIAYRESESVLAILKAKNHDLSTLSFEEENPLILIAEAPEKPGNIGALLRTCDTAGLQAVFIANPKTDIYNPNIIRSSVGSVFTTKIIMGSTQEMISFLKENHFKIFCAALSSSKPYTGVDFSGKSAIVVGTEDTGLSNEWLSNSTQNIIIPMRGVVDSMNVSVAASVITFEAVRQRDIL